VLVFLKFVCISLFLNRLMMILVSFPKYVKVALFFLVVHFLGVVWLIILNYVHGVIFISQYGSYVL
jgi:hypothetical protein